MKSGIEIDTNRFLLRELTVDDVSNRYLGWLQEEDAERFISSANAIRSLTHLKEYVAARIIRRDVLFLGIFDKERGKHIGNIKYEPVDSESGRAIMGILIGEPEFRGKSVTGEVVLASGQWLKANRSIREILLRVSEENAAAIRAYEKIGFEVTASNLVGEPLPGTKTMRWSL